MKEQVKNIMYIIASQVNNQVSESTGSLFTKEDVRLIIGKIVEEITLKVDELQVEESEGKYTKEQIANAISSIDTDDIVDVDYDSADLEMNYDRQVSVRSIDYSVDTNQIEYQIFEALNNLK